MEYNYCVVVIRVESTKKRSKHRVKPPPSHLTNSKRRSSSLSPPIPTQKSLPKASASGSATVTDSESERKGGSSDVTRYAA